MYVRRDIWRVSTVTGEQDGHERRDLHRRRGENYATPQHLLLKYANRHGLIAGATGTGKTVTLQILAESFSANGVPVILSDVKGDLSGLGASGRAEFKLHGAFTDRAAKIGFTTTPTAPFR
jgi:AAA+ superfamily predicted ATPase